MNKESKTLREFTLSTTTKNGDYVGIRYGYDMSAKHSGYYVKASINGSKLSDKSRDLRRVRGLGIPAINALLDAIGTDVTGAPYDYDTASEQVVENYIQTESQKDWNKLLSFYRIQSVTEGATLATFVEKYFKASVRARKTLLKRYNNSRRITFIGMSKGVLKGLRELERNGITINGRMRKVKQTGMLVRVPYRFYYKRDTDYIRKARVKIFKQIGRKYVPFK